MDIRVKFGDSRSNGFQDIRGADFVSNERTNEHDEAPIARNASQAFRLIHFLKAPSSVYFSNLDNFRSEAAYDVISSIFVRPIVLDKCVKFRDPSLNHVDKFHPKQS